MSLIDLCERGLLPDALTRLGIRRLNAQRLRDEGALDVQAADQRFRTLLDELRQSPIAIETAAANEQHYEVPTRFFELCLGKRLKYSSCLYATGSEDLDTAEEAMLALYGQRAELADGQRILELGCGWGSLTLWMAQQFPNARITGVSNSRTQREHILAQAARRGLGNVDIITCDVNRLELPEGEFDRTVSIEMFEHMRNYQHLLGNVSRWLKPGGKLFVHIFCHRSLMYPFQTQGEDNWMGRYFFTGGLMPSADTLLHFQRDLNIEQRWLLPGTHYQRTADHWLENQDRNREEVMSVLVQAYGAADAALWNQRWRMFWMACAELFGHADGNEWLVAHYRFSK
ncbi:MAG: SAM-dependent methyltransferase [Lysobacteraceae bacterium]|nr:MAG: SAM-dependent methyltransferase [Xanthomonadaceae bacterium]